MAKDAKKVIHPVMGAKAGYVVKSEISGYSDVIWPEQSRLFGQDMRRGYEVYDEIARDGKVSSALIKRKQKLAGREWKIESPLNATAEEEKAADWIREHLSTIKFDKLCLDLLDAIHYGIAYAEILWAYDGDKVVIDKVKPRARGRFVFDKDGKLRLLSNRWDTKGEEMPDRKFLVHKFRDDDQNPYGMGLGYELFWPSQFKRRGVAFWQKFLDKWASPTPVGKVMPGTPDGDRAKLVRYLQTVNEAAAFVINIGEELETFESSRSGRAEYDPWKKAWDEEITLIILGETLTSVVGDKGSYAAAKTHSDILDDLIDMDSDLLSGTLNDSLLKWLTEFNFAGCRPPQIWWELPADELAEEELAIKRAERRLAELNLFEKQKALGFEPVDADWINTSQGQEMRVIAPQDALTADPLQLPLPKKKDSAVELSAEQDADLPSLALLAQMFQAHFDDLFGELRAAFIEADSLEAFYTRAAEIAAQPINTQFAERLGDALVLANLIGRAEVLEELKDEASFADFEYVNLPFKEQMAFMRGKVNLPSNSWTDLMRGGHDRAFVVAGANQMQIVEDFRAAVDKAIEGGASLGEFQKEFERIAEKHQWDYNGDAEWRARTIYETNMRTSYMAGRLDQMTHPDVVARRPYWQYVHAETRVPKIPRATHMGWNGLILRHDDPWWETHYPPNDWRCSCGVRTLSEADLERMGRTGPDVAPNLGTRTEVIRETGEQVQVPRGVGLGWDYQPGRTWTHGVVPRALNTPLTMPPVVSAPDIPLTTLSRPFASSPLPQGLNDEVYARAFLNPFGADIGRGVLYRDKAGQIITITDELLRDGSGTLKANKFGRGSYMPQLAESIYDPDEIWVNWQYDKVQNRWRLARNYIRAAPGDAGVAVFSYRDGLFWYGNTTFSPRKKGRVRLNYVENLRQGALLYRR